MVLTLHTARYWQRESQITLSFKLWGSTLNCELPQIYTVDQINSRRTYRCHCILLEIKKHIIILIHSFPFGLFNACRAELCFMIQQYISIYYHLPTLRVQLDETFPYGWQRLTYLIQSIQWQLMFWGLERNVYSKKYAHGFVVLCFVVVMQSFIMNSHEVFIHIHQGCFAGTGAIVRLPQCQWCKPDGYRKISQCITTTKHSKAITVCIFLGIYCKGPVHQWPIYWLFGIGIFRLPEVCISFGLWWLIGWVNDAIFTAHGVHKGICDVEADDILCHSTYSLYNNWHNGNMCMGNKQTQTSTGVIEYFRVNPQR